MSNLTAWLGIASGSFSELAHAARPRSGNEAAASSTANEPSQSEAARKLVESAEIHGERLYVSTLVLAELAWVLRGTRYACSRTEIADALDALLDATVFEIQDRDLVRSAATAFRTGPADFSDSLIGQFDRRAGCAATLTFDRRLLTTEGFTEPYDDAGYRS